MIHRMHMQRDRNAVIAMSGGVDSSVAAYLMTKNGYTCIGATMRLFRNPNLEPIYSRSEALSTYQRRG